MVTVVVFINTLIALILFYVAWQVWQLRLRLASIADSLIAIERSTYKALHGAPDGISRGKLAIHKLRQRNQPPELQLLRVQRFLTLLGIGQQIWQRTLVVRRSSFLKNAFVKRYR